MVLIRQNKGAKIILHAKSPTFRAAKLKGFTVPDNQHSFQQATRQRYVFVFSFQSSFFALACLCG